MKNSSAKPIFISCLFCVLDIEFDYVYYIVYYSEHVLNFYLGIDMPIT